MKVDLTRIEALLKDMGISEQSTKNFVQICESWLVNEKDKLQKEFKARLDRSKQICVEEVESHKASLSRGVQKFLEAKHDEIIKSAAKQSAIAESEATDKLKHISKLLGLTTSGNEEQILQAESKKNALLTKETATLREELAQEKAKVAKFSNLVEKGLERQKTLERQIAESKNLLEEARSRITSGKTISEMRKTKKAAPKTSRAVISESDSKKPSTIHSDDEIDIIAKNM